MQPSGSCVGSACIVLLLFTYKCLMKIISFVKVNSTTDVLLLLLFQHLKIRRCRKAPVSTGTDQLVTQQGRTHSQADAEAQLPEGAVPKGCVGGVQGWTRGSIWGAPWHRWSPCCTASPGVPRHLPCLRSHTASVPLTHQ